MIPSAAQLAEENLKANLLALPNGFELARELPPSEVVFARDGTLTCKINGEWMSGCSVPLAAAKELLDTMKLECPTGVFLEPTHPAQVKAAIGKLGKRQAIIAAIADRATLTLFLLCENFSEELRAGRLFLCVREQLGEVLAANPGLPIPQMFIKTILLGNEKSETLIREMTGVINSHNEQRNAEMARLHGEIRANPNGKWVVWGPMDFHPGDYAARFLARNDGGPVLVNADRVDESSPLGLMMKLNGSRGLFVLRLTRADMPFVPGDFPIATWVLKDPIPRGDGNLADLLVVGAEAMKKRALEMGWRRVEVGSCGVEKIAGAGHGVFVYGGTRWKPAGEREFVHSSHRLLYEAIGAELSERPFNLTADVGEFLGVRAKKLDVRMEDLDLRVFVDEMIFPAYTQGLTAFLKSQGVEVVEVGGEMESWEQWDRAMAKARVVVNARPYDAGTALEYGGRAVVNPLGLGGEELMGRIRGAKVENGIGERVLDLTGL